MRAETAAIKKSAIHRLDACAILPTSGGPATLPMYPSVVTEAMPRLGWLGSAWPPAMKRSGATGPNVRPETAKAIKEKVELPAINAVASVNDVKSAQTRISEAGFQSARALSPSNLDMAMPPE